MSSGKKGDAAQFGAAPELSCVPFFLHRHLLPSARPLPQFGWASPRPVRWFSAVALDAVQPHPEPAAAAFRGDDPRATLPRRVVADVLVVPALQLGHPVPFLILVEARNPTLHRDPPAPWFCRCSTQSGPSGPGSAV